jgi:hypothetical protein
MQPIIVTADFSTEALKVRRAWNYILQALKKLLLKTFYAKRKKKGPENQNCRRHLKKSYTPKRKKNNRKYGKEKIPLDDN